MSWWANMVSAISGDSAVDDEPVTPPSNPLSPPHPHAHMPTSFTSPNEFRASPPRSPDAFSSDASAPPSAGYWSLDSLKNTLAATSSSLTDVYKRDILTFASSLTEEVKSLVVDTALAAGSVMGAVSVEVSSILNPTTAPGLEPSDMARLEQLHQEDNVFLVDGTGDEWAAWRVQFAQLWSPRAFGSPNFFHNHCVGLLEGSESLAAAFTSFVPSPVAEERFWCRYLHVRRRIVPHELALFVLESDAATFACEPDEIDFVGWKEVFFRDWEQEDGDVAADCEVALEKSQLLSWQYQQLVPADVCARDFWSRYLYRRAILVRNLSKIEQDSSSAVFAPPAEILHETHSTAIADNLSGTNATNAASDSNVFHSPQSTASTPSGETSLPGDVAAPAEHRMSHADLPSTLAFDPGPSSQTAAPSSQVASSSHVTSQGPSSLDVDGWDEWE